MRMKEVREKERLEDINLKTREGRKQGAKEGRKNEG